MNSFLRATRSLHRGAANWAPGFPPQGALRLHRDGCRPGDGRAEQHRGSRKREWGRRYPAWGSQSPAGAWQPPGPPRLRACFGGWRPRAKHTPYEVAAGPGLARGPSLRPRGGVVPAISCLGWVPREPPENAALVLPAPG